MRDTHVLNLGAGVQSTTLYLMALESGSWTHEPPESRTITLSPGPDGYWTRNPQAVATAALYIDVAIFADTGDEPEAVYRHLEWLQSLKGPPILIRSAGSRLGDDLRYGTRPTGQGKARFAAIPAFTIVENSGAPPGRTKRQCSKEYKTEVIERSIRRDLFGRGRGQRILKGNRVHQYFGISLDERSRATRIWERFNVTAESKFEPHFPLIDKSWTRANCIDYLQGRVPHPVPRSACVYCPFHTDAEWASLKAAGGADWDRAVEVDALLRTTGAVANRDMTQSMYVHRSCKPLDQAEFRPRQNIRELQLGLGLQDDELLGFDVECEGVCGV